MNQIICTLNSNLMPSNESLDKVPRSNLYFSKETDSNFLFNTFFVNKRHYFYKILFYILFSISFFTFLYYLYFRYSLYSSEMVSKGLLNNFSITSLYKNNSPYTTNFLSSNTSFAESPDPKVIGVIEIKKLNITYPILSEINKNVLKISPCRFYGPYPNEPGNLCIAAHNYKNGTFFSNLSNLVNGDIIKIYDVNNFALEYIVYKVYKTSANDLSCTEQNTNNLKIVTLITCDSLDNHYRNIVKAKAI